MMAAKKGSVGIVRKLIRHGASVNLTNKVNNLHVKLCVLEFGRRLQIATDPGTACPPR